MRILMVGPDSNAKGGIATVIHNFNYYSGEHQITYLSSWTEQARIVEGVQAIIRIKKIILTNKIDIVHFHVAQNGSFFRKFCLALRIPRKTKVIFHMHASQFDSFYQNASKIKKFWIRKTLEKTDRLVVLSPEWQAFYQKITQVPISVIENAVEVPDENQYQSENRNIVTFGRLGRRKGSYDILKVAEAVAKSVPDITFLLYGDGEVTLFKEEIAKRKLKNVKIGGWINKKKQQEIMGKTLLHFLPSYSEGLPMAILETMAEGIPNIASNVGGIPQVIQHQENGFTAEPGDINSFIEFIELLAKDECLRTSFSTNAYQMIAQHFSLEKYFAKWDQLYLIV